LARARKNSRLLTEATAHKRGFAKRNELVSRDGEGRPTGRRSRTRSTSRRIHSA
jgi:hypothetical protein